MLAHYDRAQCVIWHGLTIESRQERCHTWIRLPPAARTTPLREDPTGRPLHICPSASCAACRTRVRVALEGPPDHDLRPAARGRRATRPPGSCWPSGRGSPPRSSSSWSSGRDMARVSGIGAVFGLMLEELGIPRMSRVSPRGIRDELHRPAARYNQRERLRAPVAHARGGGGLGRAGAALPVLVTYDAADARRSASRVRRAPQAQAPRPCRRGRAAGPAAQSAARTAPRL